MSGNVHATAIAVCGFGILLRGPARTGKSALALSTLRRAEALGRPCGLVADDQVLLTLTPSGVLASAPAAIGGLIEVSGVGILPETAAPATLLALVVDLCEPGAIERLPEEGRVTLLGAALRRIALPVREAAFGADVLHSLVPFLSSPALPSDAQPDDGPARG